MDIPREKSTDIPAEQPMDTPKELPIDFLSLILDFELN